MKLSTEEKVDLEKSVIRLDEASKGHANTIIELRRATNFAEKQANIPQDLLRGLSEQIKQFQKIMLELTNSQEGQGKKLMNDEHRQKEQDLRDSLAREQMFNTALNESLVTQRQELVEKEDARKILESELANTQSKLQEAQIAVNNVVASKEDLSKKVRIVPLTADHWLTFRVAR